LQILAFSNKKTIHSYGEIATASQAYGAQAPKFELARELIAARTLAGLTQGEMAARMGTTQSVVARIESGRGTPSMRTVQRFASAVGARAVVRMEPLTAA
jgi:DNA-binding XRE family transcriptional regulator